MVSASFSLTQHVTVTRWFLNDFSLKSCRWIELLSPFIWINSKFTPSCAIDSISISFLLILTICAVNHLIICYFLPLPLSVNNQPLWRSQIKIPCNMLCSNEGPDSLDDWHSEESVQEEMSGNRCTSLRNIKNENGIKI